MRGESRKFQNAKDGAVPRLHDPTRKFPGADSSQLHDLRQQCLILAEIVGADKSAECGGAWLVIDQGLENTGQQILLTKKVWPRRTATLYAICDR
jgi:hypothetical protein